jgi:hypothetical protein
MVKIAWEREEVVFIDVSFEARALRPLLRIQNASCEGKVSVSLE